MPWRFLSEQNHVAEKEHECTLCGLIIPIGETYTIRKGIADKQFIVMKMHIVCKMATNDWTQDDWEIQCDHQTFQEHLMDYQILYKKLHNKLDKVRKVSPCGGCSPEGTSDYSQCDGCRLKEV